MKIDSMINKKIKPEPIGIRGPKLIGVTASLSLENFGTVPKRYEIAVLNYFIEHKDALGIKKVY